MSLILEALRKSEAERRFASAPGLMTPMSPPPPRRRSLLPWLVLPLLLLVGVAGGWLGRGGIAPTERADDSATRAGTSIPAPAEGLIAADMTPAPAVNPDRRPEAAKAAVRRSGDRGDRGDRGEAASPPPLTTQAAVRDEPPPPTQVQSIAAPTAVSQPAPAPPAVVPPAVTEVAVAPARTPALDTTPPVATATEQAERLPGLEAVPAARRNALPPLRVSMHVFAGEPADRFVLIDGRRYTRGQSIEAGLVVDEIRRDGVVLAVDGTRVLLSRP